MVRRWWRWLRTLSPGRDCCIAVLGKRCELGVSGAESAEADGFGGVRSSSRVPEARGWEQHGEGL